MGVIAGRFSTMFYGESIPESSYRINQLTSTPTSKKYMIPM